MGIEVNHDTPAYGHRTFQVFMTQPETPAGKTIGPNKLTYNDEMIKGWMGVGTQLNGLGHVGVDNVYYNGNREVDFVTVHGVKKLGLEKVPPIVTRGVLLDMAAHFGTDLVREGTSFGAAAIEAVARKQNVQLRKGDVVLFHTGWLGLIGKDDKRFLAGGPGIDREAARYLAAKGVVAVGADTWALEVVPAEPGAGTFEVNQFLIAKKGIYVLENIQTAALAKDKAYEFLFVLGHPKYTGTTQAIINPVAIR
ncbi:cyclase family protein [Pendulispora albinea]|uniref:Cyclase family protein n=1 Tax=Pendulispora albinea TaxID=2741071 RepID=A0ABZ2LK41_9BACT